MTFLRKPRTAGGYRTAAMPTDFWRVGERPWNTSFPSGYLVFGDALCSFNPVYGQGMSVALLEAVELQALVGAKAANLAMRFFERASKLVDTPWSIAVGSDLRMTEAVGPRFASWRFTNWYMSRLHRAAHTDPVCALAFHRVGKSVGGTGQHPAAGDCLSRPTFRPDRPIARPRPRRPSRRRRPREPNSICVIYTRVSSSK